MACMNIIFCSKLLKKLQNQWFVWRYIGKLVAGAPVSGIFRYACLMALMAPVGPR